MMEAADQRGTGVMTANLIERARGGDGAAVGELVEPYQRELMVHCYRMLGSAQDAEDALQETLLAAWRGFAGFEGRASVRTWLYRIATSRCLNALRTAHRRPTRRSRRGSARWSGSSRTRMLCSVSSPTVRPVRTPATRPGKRSPWPS